MARAKTTATKAAETPLARLKAGPVVPLPADESWERMLARTTRPGRVCEVESTTYFHFRFARLPRWHGPGGEWAFADNDDPLRLFWRDGTKFLCRQLTTEESAILRSQTPTPPAPPAPPAARSGTGRRKKA